MQENSKSCFLNPYVLDFSYSRTLGKLEMKHIDFFQDTLGLVQGLTSALGQSSQTVPLIANTLASGVDRRTVMILECAEK